MPNSLIEELKQTPVGEDVKVMGYRHQRTLTLTVAIAFDRFIADGNSYFARKAAIYDQQVIALALLGG